MKNLIVWATLALMLEISLLYGLNNFVFTNSSVFNSKKIEVKKELPNGINVTIPSNAENIDLSYEGKYLTYFKEKNLYIEDTKTGHVSEINTENNEVIMCCKWLDSRDLITIVEKVKKDEKEEVQLITYNPANSSKTFVKEICKYEKNIKVKNITTSVLTGVYYIEINKDNLKSIVYRVDRNDALTNVDINAEILVNMQVIPHEDRLVYEDKVTGKIFVTSPNRELTFKSNNKIEFIGIDRNDVIYVGELIDNRIVSILYGKVDENTSSWEKMSVDLTIGINDLYFNNKSEILINDNVKQCIKNLTNCNENKYNGKFIQIKDDFIATVDKDGNLKFDTYK